MSKEETSQINDAHVLALAERVANAKTSAEVTMAFQSFSLQWTERKEREELNAILELLKPIFEKGGSGKYLIDLDQKSVTKLAIKKSNNRTRAITVIKDGVEVGKYNSAAAACQQLGLELGTDSAIRVLERNNYQIQKVI